MSLKMHIKKGDQVLVISGKDKGKKGKVLAVMPASRKVIVEGVAMAKKHAKPRRQGETGGIIDQELAIYASKVMHICNSCGEPTRIGRKLVDDKKVRYCKKCDEIFND